MREKRERKTREHESKAFTDYRRLLQYYVVRGARDCIQAALTAGKANPFEFDCQLEPAPRHAATKALKLVLSRFPAMSELLEESLFQIQREVLEETSRNPLLQELYRLLTMPTSLDPAETTALKQASCAFGHHFRESYICIYDAYVGTGSEFGPRRRDLAVVWDGFEGIAWPERVATIKRVFVYPRFSVIGITPKEVETNQVPGISAHVRTAPKIDATRVSDIVGRLRPHA